MSALTDEEIDAFWPDNPPSWVERRKIFRAVIEANNAKVLKDMKPAFQLKWNSRGDSRYTVSEPNIGDTDVYSAYQVAALVQERDRYKEALERLSCLGNGDRPGNSTGNMIATEALKATS